MNFIETLQWRGLLQDVSDMDGIQKLGATDSFYVGLDPSAPSLQIGNLVPLIVAAHLGRAGLKPIILFGGSTGSIGDPSGKRAERPLLDRATIDDNVRRHSAKVAEIYERLNIKADFVNNYDWTASVSIIDFLREVGKHFTLSYMLSKEFVKTRVEEDSISYTEFSYMLLQSFDFLHLYQHKDCKLQIGGSDQWGNITSGLELIRKKIGGSAYAFSIPLILDSQGRKFGKSEGSAVYLDGTMTSPYKFHQFWLNLEDASVIKYLKIFSFLEKAEIDELEKKVQSAPEKREAQQTLADLMTTLVHGEAGTREAKQSAEVLFGGSIAGLSEQQLENIFNGVPSTTIERAKLATMSMADIMAETKLASSKGEARRLITSGGAYLNNERVSDPALALAQSAAAKSNIFVLRSGKKNYHLVKIS
ncbi:MAG: tyrosine--tRNA ligase [Deltaproteobacteria bacterium]|nr:tyrosine--tRNA ligase [Deltaproteobacteria bacterium]